MAMDGGWDIFSVILIFIKKSQCICSLPACFLFSIPLIVTVHGMAPQEAVDNDLAPPFGKGIRVPFALVLLYILLVGLSACGLIALTIFIDNL